MADNTQITVTYYDGKTALPKKAKLSLHKTKITLTLKEETYVWNIQECSIDATAENFIRVQLKKDENVYFTLTNPEAVNAFTAQSKKESSNTRQYQNRFSLYKQACIFFASTGILVIAGNYFAPILAKAIPTFIERTLFDSFVAEIKQNQCESIEIKERVNTYASWIKQNAEFEVIVSSSPTVNAFATPGGIVVINHGLIKKTSSPEEMIGVIAHETAHLERAHIRQSLIKNLFMSGWFIGIFGVGGQQFGLASFASPLLINSRFSVAFEIEADQIAVEKMDALGIDRKYLADFFSRHLEQTERTPAGLAVEQFFSTHPIDEDRIQRILHAPLGAFAGNETIIQIIREDHHNWGKIKQKCFNH